MTGRRLPRGVDQQHPPHVIPPRRLHEHDRPQGKIAHVDAQFPQVLSVDIALSVEEKF